MLKLYNYWRSSASYRVRIALALKDIPYEYHSIHLIKDGGQQYSPDYLALNPEGRVPLLVDGDFRLGQSLAILDYLEACHPAPSLLPADVGARAQMWAFCHAIAADIQPLQNLGPLGYLTRELGVSEAQKNAWLRHWIERGLSALEAEQARRPEREYCFGDAPTLADCVLLPQMYSAHRFGADAGKYPRLAALSAHFAQHPAARAAHPDVQPDAQPA